MLKAAKQVRAAVSMLNPENVRREAERPLNIGLAASSSAAYAEMEDFLVPGEVSHEQRVRVTECIHRAGDPGAPDRVDLLICDESIPCPEHAYRFRRDNPMQTVAEIVEREAEQRLQLARLFPAFRKPAVDRIVQAVARENALFALTSALPNIVPSLLELPWAFGEFASDTAFITINQVRMAFLIAAACGRPIGFAEQKTEVASIAAGAFGWRAIARELAGKIPLGGGLIAKGAIAFAGTYVVGKGIEHFLDVGRRLNGAEKRQIYGPAYDRGRSVVEGMLDAKGSSAA